MSQNLLLMGGTFDPVHNGHLIVARAMAEMGGFDKILLIPTAQPPHKDGPSASGQHRLEMLRLAVAGEAIFEICDIEIARGGPSYTLLTIQDLQLRYPQSRLNWVIGADMLEGLPLWHRIEDVLGMVRMRVAVRPPWQERLDQIFQSLQGRLSQSRLDELRRSVLATPLIDISSSAVRQRVREEKSVRFMIPDMVTAYIQQNCLYRAK